MSTFFKSLGRLGAIIALIMLFVGLLKQIIALISTLIFAIKFGVIALFAGMLLLIVFSMIRGKQRRRREMEDL